MEDGGAHGQKSLSLFARGQYGNSEFNYKFFPNLDLENFQALILRNSGNDWNFTMLRDGFMTSLFHDVDLDVQAYRPMLVYLNGEFWGLYNLCLLYTSPSPRDEQSSRMPSSA